MNSIRKRLTYANVMSSIAIVLAIGGATAFAATQLKKNSVGTKQLKKNAVTQAKIKKNAVTGAKIKDGAVNGAKIADGSVTGSEIAAGTTPFGQVVARLRSTATVPFTAGQFYPLSPSAFTQNPGEDAQILAAVDVNFPAGCTQPRGAQAYLMIDAANPAVLNPLDLAGVAVVQDTGVGAVTRTLNFAPFPGGYKPLAFQAPSAATGHTFTMYLAGSSCAAGSGVTATGAGIDVIGTK